MQVLKFGGSSVANAENMSKVVDIVTKAVDRDRTILVTSAISGCTDALIKIGHLASERDDSYKTLIDELQTKHHTIIKDLLPVEKQDESREVCDSLFNSLRSITQGVYLLGELSPEPRRNPVFRRALVNKDSCNQACFDRHRNQVD